MAERDRSRKSQVVGQGFTAFLMAIVVMAWAVAATTAAGIPVTQSLGQAEWSIPRDPAFERPHFQLWPTTGFNQRYVRQLQHFESLILFLQAANQLPDVKISLAVRDCDNLSIRYSPLGQELSLCYGLLSYLEDSFDDLSASPRERELAVLDALYFLVVRQLAQIILTNAGLPQTGRSLDELTAVLPAVLNQPTPGIVLSGTQWIFNQGNPLSLTESLVQIQGEALTLENYDRLICTAYGIDPTLYPYLAVEFPRPEQLRNCRDSSGEIARWRRLLRP